MNDRVYYFIKPYDESLPLPPAESFAQILNEAYLHPFNWKARTTRKSFWWSTLINLVIGILCILLGFYAFNQNINPGIRIVDGIVAAVVYLWLFTNDPTFARCWLQRLLVLGCLHWLWRNVFILS